MSSSTKSVRCKFTSLLHTSYWWSIMERVETLAKDQLKVSGTGQQDSIDNQGIKRVQSECFFSCLSKSCFMVDIPFVCILVPPVPLPLQKVSAVIWIWDEPGVRRRFPLHFLPPFIMMNQSPPHRVQLHPPRPFTWHAGHFHVWNLSYFVSACLCAQVSGGSETEPFWQAKTEPSIKFVRITTHLLTQRYSPRPVFSAPAPSKP